MAINFNCLNLKKNSIQWNERTARRAYIGLNMAHLAHTEKQNFKLADWMFLTETLNESHSLLVIGFMHIGMYL